MRARGQRIRQVVALASVLGLLVATQAGEARAGSAWKTVTFRSYSVSVPRSWPVYDLSRDPSACVRFNRHAVYLGTPEATEICPAHAAGRSEAILLEPAGASAARTTPAAAAPEGSVTSFVAGGGSVSVTATWSRQRSLITRALHRDSLPAPAGRALHRAFDAHAARPVARAAQAVYTGPGFDACSAPSSQSMAAWGSSPYRALGIYIGGVNSACSQPNLNSSWVANESAAGWNMIPTYVGLQAPSNSCGCAGISPSQASAEGTAAAQDAVTDAQTLGLPPGSPIYDDMEYYSRTQTNTSAVLAFLASWTSQLHAEGYQSGVYGNSNSVISDLVAQYGTSYPEPDDIWMANWNGQASTTDADVPSTEWASHQRIHQYRGGHNETYGGVTINIDSNYLDAATATGNGAPPPPPPSLSASPTSSGITNLSAGWGGAGLSSWRVLAGTDPASLVPVASTASRGPTTSIAVRSSAPYFAVQALSSTGQWLGNSSTLSTPPHLLLFGHSVFVGATGGTGGVPVGCYLPTPCHLVTTVSLGRRPLVRTGTESVSAGGTGLLFFKLPTAALKLLDRARSGRLPVQITVKDVTGFTAAAPLSLIPFVTSGRAPAHSLSASAVISPVGFTDFVYAHGAGGILTACIAVYACPVSATLSVGRTTVASTRPEVVNGRELGYVLFSLTAQGRQLLARAVGNQLAVGLVLKVGTAVARARITLAQFS